MKPKKKEEKEMEKIILIFLIILSCNFLSGFFWLEVYQIDLNPCFVPIFRSEFGEHISILTIILRNALL